MALPHLDLRTPVHEDAKGRFSLNGTLIKCTQNTLHIVLFSRAIRVHTAIKGIEKSWIKEILGES